MLLFFLSCWPSYFIGKAVSNSRMRWNLFTFLLVAFVKSRSINSFGKRKYSIQILEFSKWLPNVRQFSGKTWHLIPSIVEQKNSLKSHNSIRFAKSTECISYGINEEKEIKSPKSYSTFSTMNELLLTEMSLSIVLIRRTKVNVKVWKIQSTDPMQLN